MTILSGLTITNAIIQLMLQNITVNNGIVNYNYSLLNTDINKTLLFILLIVNIVRFYHGNIRHLDSSYTGEFGKGSSGDLKLSGGRKIAIDFLVIFLQSIGFAVLSFTLQEPMQFFGVFVALIILDILWFLSVSKSTTDDQAAAHQKRWSINNVAMVFAMLISMVFFNILQFSNFRYLEMYVLSFILICNTIYDFQISWDFYFPEFPLGISESLDDKS